MTGIDIVREQLRIAAGEPLVLTGRAPRGGHAIEVRINAEDPARGFLPGARPIERFRPPLGPFDRVDTWVEDGTVVPPYYDSLIAKLIVWDADRPAAIARALRALGELEVRGVPTTREAAIDILRSEEFQRGDYSTTFLEEAGAAPARAESREGARDHAAAGTITRRPSALAQVVVQAAEAADGARVPRPRAASRSTIDDGCGRARARRALRPSSRTSPRGAGACRRRARGCAASSWTRSTSPSKSST